MISVHSPHQTYERNVRSVLRIIDTRLLVGMERGAKETAQSIVQDARNNLNSRARFSSGRLANAIISKNASSGFKTAARWDVIVDTDRAPYAEWVEYGADAGIGLPYSQKGTKDFSKSSFKGHRYLSDSMEEHKSGKAEEIVKGELIKALIPNNALAPSD